MPKMTFNNTSLRFKRATLRLHSNGNNNNNNNMLSLSRNIYASGTIQNKSFVNVEFAITAQKMITETHTSEHRN